MEESLNKYFTSESVTLMRSQIHPADYNPRVISEDGKKALKKSIKLYGVVGGIVVNKQTGNTIVGGHQKVFVLDELNKYDEATGENDYSLRVELIDVDLKTEKQLNITLNNPNVGGYWDMNALAQIIPDIDYKEAGLTEADLNMIGVDYLLQTEEENELAASLNEMMMPLTEQHEAEKTARKAERDALREAAKSPEPEKTQEEKIAHMRDVKQQVKEAAIQTAQNMDAYVVISFDSYDGKASFCERFGYNPDVKFIKGEVFEEQVERIN